VGEEDAQLDRLLRSSLGETPTTGDRGTSGTEEVRRRVVARVRRRRTRRLQGVGALAVVALGLGAGLPQVLGARSGPPSTTASGTPRPHGGRASGARSSGPQHGASAAIPSEGTGPDAFGGTSTSATGTGSGARCTGGPGTVTVCGELLSVPASSRARSPAPVGPVGQTTTDIPGVVLRAGHATTVTLLAPPTGRRWTQPAVVRASAAARSAAQVVEVRSEPPTTGVAPGAERFRLVAHAPGTAIVEVREATGGSGRAPAGAAGSAQVVRTTEVWLLRVEVEAT
jgi:hypothetical protein